MSHEPSKKERDIFAGALELAPDEWPAYLNRECGGDNLLRVSLEDLLKNHRNDNFIEDVAKGVRSNEKTGENVGDTIGRYNLEEVLGEGGFGVVYRAKQIGPLNLEFALKVIKPGVESKEILRCIEIERQALAILKHSSIATILDAGTTASGRPYFVMELVRGKKITEFCDRERLTVPERLELFLKVCDAVEEAHLKGIIHRDIKPSNILVAEESGSPLPKVIDFGIAKAMATQSQMGRNLVPIPDQIIGTPAYMSPEQAGLAGAEVDCRTDIYSLGVVLYELLVGCLPFAQNEISQCKSPTKPRKERSLVPSELLSKFGEKERLNVAYCRRVEPTSLVKLLVGDLDGIALRCLHRSREQRYETVGGLRNSVCTFLNAQREKCSTKSEVAEIKMERSNRKGRWILSQVPFLFACATVVFVVALLCNEFYQQLRGRVEIEAHPVIHPFSKDEITFEPSKAFDDFVIYNADVTVELEYPTEKKTLVASQRWWCCGKPITITLPENYSKLQSFSIKGSYDKIYHWKGNAERSEIPFDVYDQKFVANTYVVRGYAIYGKWDPK